MNKKEGDYLKNNKAQMQIGFGMIFSVILIVVFIVFAVYGIIKFLDIQKFAQIESFKQDFQNHITDALRSDSISKPMSYSLPKNVRQVCFANNKDENMYFVPSEYEGALLKNIDIAKTVTGPGSVNRKLCIDVQSGKFSVVIKKETNENLVTLTK